MSSLLCPFHCASLASLWDCETNAYLMPNKILCFIWFKRSSFFIDFRYDFVVFKIICECDDDDYDNEWWVSVFIASFYNMFGIRVKIRSDWYAFRCAMFVNEFVNVLYTICQEDKKWWGKNALSIIITIQIITGPDRVIYKSLINNLSNRRVHFYAAIWFMCTWFSYKHAIA